MTTMTAARGRIRIRKDEMAWTVWCPCCRQPVGPMQGARDTHPKAIMLAEQHARTWHP